MMNHIWRETKQKICDQERCYYWPIAVQCDCSVRHDLEYQTHSRVLVTVDAQQTALLVVKVALAGHHHQVAGALHVRALQLHSLHQTHVSWHTHKKQLERLHPISEQLKRGSSASRVGVGRIEGESWSVTCCSLAGYNRTVRFEKRKVKVRHTLGQPLPPPLHSLLTKVI